MKPCANHDKQDSLGEVHLFAHEVYHISEISPDGVMGEAKPYIIDHTAKSPTCCIGADGIVIVEVEKSGSGAIDVKEGSEPRALSHGMADPPAYSHLNYIATCIGAYVYGILGWNGIDVAILAFATSASFWHERSEKAIYSAFETLESPGSNAPAYGESVFVSVWFIFRNLLFVFEITPLRPRVPLFSGSHRRPKSSNVLCCLGLHLLYPDWNPFI